MSKSTAIFGGAGLGILIGLLIGMSTSGIVGLVIGTLTSILLVLLGFKEKGDSNLQTLRVGAFGLFCSLAILLGLYLRVNNTFSPTVKSQMDMWTIDSVFTKEETKIYFLYDRFGFVPSGVTIDSSLNNKRTQGVLYGSNELLTECDKAEGYKNFSAENQINAYKRLGGQWQKFANSVEGKIDIENQKTALNIFYDCICNK